MQLGQGQKLNCLNVGNGFRPTRLPETVTIRLELVRLGAILFDQTIVLKELGLSLFEISGASVSKIMTPDM